MIFSFKTFSLPRVALAGSRSAGEGKGNRDDALLNDTWEGAASAKSFHGTGAVLQRSTLGRKDGRGSSHGDSPWSKIPRPPGAACAQPLLPPWGSGGLRFPSRDHTPHQSAYFKETFLPQLQEINFF